MDNKENERPAVTREDLKKFYQDVVDGKWQGREREVEVEEIRLLKALGVKVK